MPAGRRPSVGSLPNRAQRSNRFEQLRQPLCLRRKRVTAARRQTIVSTSSRIIVGRTSGGLRDKPRVDQVTQVTIERARLERDPAGGQLTDSLHHGVSVLLPV